MKQMTVGQFVLLGALVLIVPGVIGPRGTGWIFGTGFGASIVPFVLGRWAAKNPSRTWVDLVVLGVLALINAAVALIAMRRGVNWMPFQAALTFAATYLLYMSTRPSATAPIAPSPNPPDGAGRVFCTQCGQPAPPEARFCSRCGQSLA